MKIGNRGRQAPPGERASSWKRDDGAGEERRKACRADPVAAEGRAAAGRARVPGLVAVAALVAAVSVAAGPTAAAAQQEPGAAAAATEDRPAADPADVESVDAIVTALYDVISGAEGEARDWDRLRSLLYPGAIFLPNYPGQSGPRPMTVEEFIEFAKETIQQQQGFHESEIHRTVQRYGPVVNVFSTYETRESPGAEPSVRGINSIQLVHDGDRWWVAHIAWTDVREAGPIPERYGGGGG